MPPIATRRVDGICSRCGRTIPKGARFTWGKEKRIFHAGTCPDYTAPRVPEILAPSPVEPRTAPTPTPAPPAPIESQEPTGSLDEAIRHIAREAAKGAASAAALDSIRDEVAALRALVTGSKPMTIELTRPDGTVYTGKGGHSLLPELLELVGLRENVYLYGLPGGGKSTGARMAAEYLGLRYAYFALNPQTPDSRLFGYMDATGNYRSTDLYTCYKDGGVVCIDELDNAAAALLTTLNGLIENGHGSFPCGMVERHPDFVMVATGNTTGRGGDVLFPERRIFDAAFMERFVYLEWTYDLGLEETLTMGANPKASAWLAWTRTARAFCATNKIRLFLSPRCSIKGAKLLASGKRSVDTVANMIAFRGINEDIRARVVSACPLPRVSMSVAA